MKKLDIFDYAALILIFCISLLIFFKWKFPTFVDIYYHLSVMRGFDMAGGIVLHDFWEFAPVGRAHINPPFLNLIMLILYKLGLDVLTIGKIFSFSMFPLSLITVWFYMREIFDIKIAFYSVLLLTVPFQWFWSQTATVAGALVLVLAPLIFYFIEVEKKITSILLMIFCLYSHLAWPHAIALALLIYGFFLKEKIGIILTTLGVSYLFYLPWGLHVYKNLETVYFGQAQFYYIELNLIPLILALFGIAICLKKRGEYYLLPSLLFGMLPLLIKHPQTAFWHTILPISMLGGVCVAILHNEIIKKIGKNMYYETLVIFLILLTFNLGNPVIFTSTFSGEINLTIEDTTILKVIDYQPNEKMQIGYITNKYKEIGSEDTIKLVELVEANTKENDIIFTNEGVYGSFITSFTGRGQTGGMVYLFLPKGRVDYSLMSLVVLVRWEKEDFIQIFKKLEPDKKVPSLSFIDKIGEITVYKVVDGKNVSMNIPKPVISGNLAFLLVFIGLILIFIDLRFLSS